MRRFFLTLIVFFTGMLVLNLLIYFFITRKLLYEEYEVDTKILNRYHDFIFSDSHGWRVTKNNLVAEKKLANLGIFNFSYGSDSYCDMYIKLFDLLEKNVKIDTIFLSADDHTLSKKRAVNNNKNRSIFYASPTTFKKVYRESTGKFIFRKYIAKYLPMLYRANQQLIQKYVSQILVPDPQIDKDRVKWANLSVAERKQRAVEKLEDFYPSLDASPMVKNCLKMMFDLADQKGFEIIGVKFPLSPTLVQGLKDRSTHADSMFLSRGFQLIDLRDSLKDEAYFLNQDHVNEAGGTLFVDKFLKMCCKKSDL